MAKSSWGPESRGQRLEHMRATEETLKVEQVILAMLFICMAKLRMICILVVKANESKPNILQVLCLYAHI